MDVINLTWTKRQRFSVSRPTHLNQVRQILEQVWTNMSYRKSQRSVSYDLCSNPVELTWCQPLLHRYQRIRSHHLRARTAEAMANLCVLKCSYFSSTIKKKKTTYSIQVKNQPPKRTSQISQPIRDSIQLYCTRTTGNPYVKPLHPFQVLNSELILYNKKAE